MRSYVAIYEIWTGSMEEPDKYSLISEAMGQSAYPVDIATAAARTCSGSRRLVGVIAVDLLERITSGEIKARELLPTVKGGDPWKSS